MIFEHEITDSGFRQSIWHFSAKLLIDGQLTLGLAIVWLQHHFAMLAAVGCAA
jgi:hypothetical protein